MSRSPIEYIRHILAEAEYISTRLEEMTVEGFLEDEDLNRAVVRSLEVMGEAVKRMPDDFRGKYPDFPWRSTAGMRDIMIHQYMSVDYDIVWDVAKREIPEMLRQLEAMLKNEGVNDSR
jgi:uncharacterized protein with HEPN domain